MKCQLSLTLALFLIISLAANALLYRDFVHTVSDNIEQVNKNIDGIGKTLKSHDGRRNAQYGVLKAKLEAGRD